MESNGITLDALVIPKRRFGPQFGGTDYMSEVNRARKVKSDAPV